MGLYKVALFVYLILLCQIFFSSNSLHKSKNNDLKCCPNNEIFSTELSKTTSDSNSAQMLMRFRYFALNKLRIIRKKFFKLYPLLILLYGDVSLIPGSSQHLPDNENEFELFRKRGLHFHHINVNSSCKM